MKKTKRVIATLGIAGMALIMIPFNAFAMGTIPTRLAGITAEETAVKIADQTGWTGTVILSSSASYGMAPLNISPLKGITKLTKLSLNYYKISDMDDLKELTSLTSLGLIYSEISDIDQLRGLTNLTTLGLVQDKAISNLGY